MDEVQRGLILAGANLKAAGLAGSLTGNDFDTKPLAPGSFSFGISITRQGTWLALAMTTPRHAEPATEAKP